MLKNRIEKNWNKLKAWSKQQGIEAFRVYDRDIPEFQVIVDRYKDYFVIYDKTDSVIDKNKNVEAVTQAALTELFQATPENMIWKSRERQSGLQQYEKLAKTDRSFIIQEGPAKFIVNLWDYLDTGLFLDHRPMRHRLFKSTQGKNLLNLFCYTSSISVVSALGGARTTSVDMSTTYLDWAEANFKQNNLDISKHQFIRADILEWIKDFKPLEKFDLIFLDPPTFSNSKKMLESFEVEREQVSLITSAMKLLDQDGILYFSTNKRSFKMEASLMQKYSIKNISAESIPRDFHDQKIHQCYEIRFQK